MWWFVGISRFSRFDWFQLGKNELARRRYPSGYGSKVDFSAGAVAGDCSVFSCLCPQSVIQKASVFAGLRPVSVVEPRSKKWASEHQIEPHSAFEAVRELAIFNLGIDSKLRGCDLIALKVRDVCHDDQVATRAIVMQHKTKRPVQFEITAVTRESRPVLMKPRQSSLRGGVNWVSTRRESKGCCPDDQLQARTRYGNRMLGKVARHDKPSVDR